MLEIKEEVDLRVQKRMPTEEKLSRKAKKYLDLQAVSCSSQLVLISSDAHVNSFRRPSRIYLWGSRSTQRST
jgi:hypothetical protein